MIQPAGPAHAAAMAAIHAACFPARERWGADAIGLHFALPGAFGLIDPEGAMLIARIAADEAEILTLAVLPALRRQGRARALVQHAAGRVAGSGVRSLFLEVAEDNAAALALYRGLGFAEIGRRRRYYPAGQDALVLRLDVPN